MPITVEPSLQFAIIFVALEHCENAKCTGRARLEDSSSPALSHRRYLNSKSLIFEGCHCVPYDRNGARSYPLSAQGPSNSAASSALVADACRLSGRRTHPQFRLLALRLQCFNHRERSVHGEFGNSPRATTCRLYLKQQGAVERCSLCKNRWRFPSAPAAWRDGDAASIVLHHPLRGAAIWNRS